MKFKTYLDEAHYEGKGRSTEISVEEAVTLVNKNCKKAWNGYLKGNVIYRGITIGPDWYLFVDPTQHTRVSANTYNFYTLFIDNSPDWSAYPKRSKSIVCTNSKVGASGYGREFIVFPYDKAKIGVCQSYDFWASFKKAGVDDLDNFNQALLRIFEHFDKSFEARVITYERFIQSVEAVGKRAIEAFASGNWWGPPPGWIKTNRTLKECISQVLDPKKNGFKVIKPGQTLPSKEVELWIGDAPSILVEYKHMPEFSAIKR